MKPTLRIFTLLLGLLLMAACAPVQPSATAPETTAAVTGEAEAAAATEPAQAAADTAGASLPEGMAAALANEIGIAPEEMTVVSVEAVEWNDACLGVAEAGQMCAQVITPGYRIVVEVGGEQFTYHTDRGGNSVILAPNAQAQPDKGAVELGFLQLAYAGPEEVGSDDTSRCALLNLNNNEARLTACDGTETALPLPEGLADNWRELGERVGAFEVETPTEQLSFTGRGESAEPAWQRAALAWARLTRAELASGQTSASARTALSWNLGLLADTPDVCAHLTVLDFGYAYAEQRACESGDLVSSVEGWLEGAEMEQFDAWLYGYAPLYRDDNYLNGVGEASMAEEEALAVATWAQAVWTRLTGLPLAPVAEEGATAAASASAATCTAPDGGDDVFESVEYGFCLVTPPGYAIVETAPGNFSLVAGGDVMNHVDPRVSIEVSEAGGSTLAQVAEELAANYVPAGETVEQATVTAGGVEGVLLDNLVGQDRNRRLAFVHNGRIYNLMLMPLSPDAEPFYQAVLDSLRFTSEP
jgi:hypothetical protein